MENFVNAAGKASLEIKGLINVQKFFAQKMPKVRVGILGDKNARKKGGADKTNAEIGYTQEFGKHTGVKIPKRSFIREPLLLKFAKEIKAAKSLNKTEFEKAIKSGNAEKFFKRIGIVAEKVIQQAFATQGFGKWAPNAPLTVALKGSSSPLIDTAQLRRSITSKVVKGNEK
jgi:hypothetical protein